jgi:REP element-mobilizing transposase RayT
MATTREPFEPENWYHIFNHARGNDDLFETDLDFKTFLELVLRYIEPVAEIYAYCLIQNHFHFLVRFNDVEIPESFKKKDASDFLSHQWGNVQNTYTKKKNYRTGNRGGLFCQSINRNLMSSEEYLQMCIVYIHNNPVKHGLCYSPEKWEYSSYNSIISDRPTRIKRDEVLGWFESKGNFIKYHNSKADDIFAEKYNLD